MHKFIVINVLVAGTLLGFRAEPSNASEIDKKTIITISGPVQIPGTVLPAGTYVVKRADPNLPNALRFQNKEGTHIFATVMTVPVIRSTPSSKVEVTMAETRGTKPVALSTWFYPGDITGQQFIYPRGGDVLMAMFATEVQGLAPEPANEPEEKMTSKPEAQVASIKAEEAPARSEENIEIAQSSQPSNQPAASTAPSATMSQGSTQQTPEEQPAKLPQTAGLLPLLALCGAGIFAGGTGLKAILKKQHVETR